jgi:UDP-3-O-[3-hydroxymyristoyl] N-acetylglucosamine deacetylase
MDRTRAARQKTLKSAVRCAGVGLHSGHPITMILHPASIDAGISFRRADAGVAIAATWRNLVPSCLCSTLAENGVSVGTVEHLMAAFAGLEIDNALVELDGAEVPAMDGSAAPFVSLIERAGVVEQNAPRRAIEILQRVRVAGDGAEAALEPADGFSLCFVIDFASGTVGRQRLDVAPDPENFKRRIARARTFGFFDEVAQMRAAGLALGGSLDNAVVIGEDGVMNKEGLRYRDEFVRHKVLDAMGDLYLAGGPIIGRFTGHRSGHALNRRLLQRLFADANAWRFTTLETERSAAWQDAPHRATA